MAFTPVPINYDSVQTTIPGFQYSDHEWEVTVGHDFLVYSRDKEGILNSLADNSLVNDGVIISNGSTTAAVSFAGDGNFITNHGIIRGTYDGIRSNGRDTQIINHGDIIGQNHYGVFVDFDQSFNTHLTNRGAIFGASAGVVTSFGVTDNYGTITSGGYGIVVIADDNIGATVDVHNKRGAVIGGSEAALLVIYGRLILVNDGTMTGDVAGGNAVQLETGIADVITNRGTILGNVVLHGGNDIFNGKGGKSGAVYGQGGDDRLIGGNGKDILIGGTEKDKMTGGRGADKFEFDFTGESTVARRDVITDFKHGQHDKIDLHVIDANTVLAGDQAFKFIGAAGFHDRAGELRAVHRGNHVLVSGDVDGNGTADFLIEVHGAANLVRGDFIL